MSTHWDVHCRTCDKGLGLHLNHEEGTMRWLIANRETLAAFAENVKPNSEPGSWRDLMLSMGAGWSAPSIDPKWFLEHRGHDLAPRDEYGGFSGQCGEYPACSGCGSRQRCALPIGHDAECKPRGAT